MPFVPIIDFCVEKNVDGNNQIIVTDITKPYDPVNNTTGWNHVSTLQVPNVTEATITIEYYDVNGNIVSTINNVLTQLVNPVVGDIQFTPYIFSGDGLYLIKYKLKTSTTTYETCKQKVLYPEVSCCISNKISKLASNLDNNKLFENVQKLKLFEKVLFTASKTVDQNTALKVLSSMIKLCKNDCGCGC